MEADSFRKNKGNSGESMAFEVKVTRQGQMTILKELRDRYRIK